MRNPGKGRLLTFEPSSGNWRKNLGTDIRNGSVKKYPIIGIPFGLRPHSIPIMGNDTVNGILPPLLRFDKIWFFEKNIRHFRLFDKLFNIDRFAFFHIRLFEVRILQNDIMIVLFESLYISSQATSFPVFSFTLL